MCAQRSERNERNQPNTTNACHPTQRNRCVRHYLYATNVTNRTQPTQRNRSIQGSDEAQASRPGGPASQASRPPKKKIFFPVTSAELFFFFSLGKIFGYLAKFGKKIWILLTSLLDRLWWFFLDFFFWIFFSEIARSQKKIFFFFLVKNFVMSKKKNFSWEAGRPGRPGLPAGRPGPHQSLAPYVALCT